MRFAQANLKEDILSKIRLISVRLGGQPVGQRTFENETGIKRSSWRGRYWATWSDALTEAGLAVNFAPEKADNEAILTFLAKAIEKYQRFPSEAEFRMFRHSCPGAPAMSTIRKQFPTKRDFVVALDAFAKSSERYRDILVHLPQVETQKDDFEASVSEGWVYLLRSGDHFKIGRSNVLERRVKQISVALPETTILLHAIQTDDQVGIETYWHKRFELKQVNGEWFSLSSKEVAAFKKRKFM